MTVSAPLDWIKRIEDAVFKLDETPQFGLPELFPLEKVEAAFKALFGQEHLSLNVHEKGWASGDQIWDGLGEHLFSLKLEMTPLQEPFYFILSEQDLAQLMSSLLGGDASSSPFYEPELTAAFYHFLAMEVMQVVEEVRFAHPLSPRIGESPKDVRAEIGSNECFLIDIAAELQHKTVWGRMLIPAAFRSALKGHFAAQPPPSLSDEAKEKIPVTLSMLIGYAELALNEFKGMSIGDCVVLDRCSYDPDEKKGNVTLMLGETPLFRGKIKTDELKILEYPRYEEVKMEDEELEEEAEDVETAEAEPVSVDALPINLTVEVGRIRMSVQELSTLSPGNLVNLDLHPDQGVNLIVSGKKIGRGELVRIGESLGVRITSM